MREKGLTGFQLKIIGLVLMVFDHIGAFFSFTGHIPIAFRWVGRIVAPIFIFMTVEGYTHTRNRKNYMLRLFLGTLFMSLGNSIIPEYFPRTDYFALTANIFGTLFTITIYLCIVDFIKRAVKERNVLKIILGIILFILPIALGMFIIINIQAVVNIQVARYLLFIIPTPLMVEGGPIFVALGIIMYLLREDRKKQLITYVIISLAIIFAGDLSIEGLFFYNYQWMMVFAAPLFYLYNGKRGKGMKYLFYIFYPAHIYIFYIISSYMMAR